MQQQKKNNPVLVLISKQGEIKIAMRLVNDGGSSCVIDDHRKTNCAVYSKSTNNSPNYFLCEVSDTGTSPSPLSLH